MPMAFQFSIFTSTSKTSMMPGYPEGRCIWKEDPITKQLKVPNDLPNAKRMAHKYKKKRRLFHSFKSMSSTWNDATAVGYQRRFLAIAY
jgi:hypothetical protein